MDGPCDAAMLVLDWPAAGNNATTWWPTLRAIEAAHEATSTPTIVAASLPENMPSHAREHLAKRGVAAAYSIDEALAGVAATAAAGRWLATPAPRIHNAAQPAPRATRTIHEAAAKHVLDSAGIATPTGIVGDPATVVVEAASLRFPLVAKAAGIDHKSEVGAVHLGLANDAELRDAVTSLSRLGASVLVEEQVENTAVELLVSVRNEAPLGQVLVIGSGGTNVEIWADTITALLPVDEAEIADMLDGLMIAPLLRGHRGRPAVGVEPIAAVVEGLQDLLTARPDIVEIEINPLIVTRHGAVAVDALISVADSQEVSHG